MSKRRRPLRPHHCSVPSRETGRAQWIFAINALKSGFCKRRSKSPSDATSTQNGGQFLLWISRRHASNSRNPSGESPGCWRRSFLKIIDSRFERAYMHKPYTTKLHRSGPHLSPPPDPRISPPPSSALARRGPMYSTEESRAAKHNVTSNRCWSHRPCSCVARCLNHSADSRHASLPNAPPPPRYHRHHPHPHHPPWLYTHHSCPTGGTCPSADNTLRKDVRRRT
jgi:hypothetical protein